MTDQMEVQEETILGFKIHPAAALVPEPSVEEFERLLRDIEDFGMREPVTLTPQGEVILDGRSRARAWEKLGYPLDEMPVQRARTIDPVAYVLSRNAARRHLKPDQIVAIYLSSEDMRKKIEALKKAAAESQRAGLKVGDSRGAPVAPTGKTALKIAKAVGVHASTVKRVLAVERKAPERLPDIRNGAVSAKKVLKGLPKHSKSARKETARRLLARQLRENVKVCKRELGQGFPSARLGKALDALIMQLRDVPKDDLKSIVTRLETVEKRARGYAANLKRNRRAGR